MRFALGRAFAAARWQQFRRAGRSTVYVAASAFKGGIWGCFERGGRGLPDQNWVLALRS
jgi:hypothetical protein